MSTFISIIIPIYNVEKYLEQCIDSVLNQTYRNFEVLLINDGSTDSSGSICDQYAAKDARVNVFHKTNEGVSTARNLGIQKAQGDYVWFIDGDDKIVGNALQILKENISPNLDVLSLNFAYFNLKENQKQANLKKEVPGIVNGDEFLKGDFRFSACTFIYQRKMLVENNICFIPHITHFEDNLFNIEVFNQAKTVIQISEQLYLYRQNRENSVMHKQHYKLIVKSCINISDRLQNVEPLILSQTTINKAITSFFLTILYCIDSLGNNLEMLQPSKYLQLKFFRKNISFKGIKSRSFDLFIFKKFPKFFFSYYNTMFYTFFKKVFIKLNRY